MIECDGTVFLDENAATVHLLLDAGKNCQRAGPPSERVIAHRMPPVLPVVLGRIGLIEQMIAALPVTQAVRIVQPALRIHVVISRPIPVCGEFLPRCRKAQHRLVRCQLGPLLLECRGRTSVVSAWEGT